MIARGLGFPDLSELVKRLYVEVAEAHFGIAGRRVTDSRISLLTGLQRKDVREHRAAIAPQTGGSIPPENPGPLSRIIARWRAGPPFADRRSRPRRLPRVADGASFEALALSVSRDLHPRTMLDELVRLGLVKHEPEKDTVVLEASAFVPGGDAEALNAYFGANLGDHAAAAAENLIRAPSPGPYFERAVHYNQLSQKSLEELDAMARRLQDDALVKLNRRALELQDQDASALQAEGRFRCGAFVYWLDKEERYE